MANSKARPIKHKLLRADMLDSYFEEKCLICMVSTWPFYRIAQQLNAHLDLDLRFDTEMNLEVEEVAYKILYDKNEMRNMEYFLICNRNKTDFLVPELVNRDYILMIDGIKYDRMAFEKLLQQIQNISAISFAHEIDAINLKSKDNLIF